MNETNDSQLVATWRETLGEAGSLHLHDCLSRFPELEHAVALPQLQTVVQEESYLLWDGEGIQAQVHVEWQTPDGARVGTMALDMYGAEGTASLEDMHLPTERQARGLGRAVVNELVALGVALGFEELITYAFDVGRYAWARCGFDFFEEDRDRVVAAAQEFAQRLGRPFDGSGIAHSWELAEFAGDDVPLSVVAVFRGDSMPAEDAPPMKFGQALLLGPHRNEWSGRLELASGSPSRMQLAKE